MAQYRTSGATENHAYSFCDMPAPYRSISCRLISPARPTPTGAQNGAGSGASRAVLPAHFFAGTRITARRNKTRQLPRSAKALDREGFQVGEGPPTLSLGHDCWPVVRPLRDRRLVDVEVLGDQLWRRMCQPVGQRYVFVAGRSEHRKKLHVGVADVLHKMSMVALDVTDITRVEVRRTHIGAGVEHRHAGFALDVILPFVGVRMPVHLPHRAGPHRYECRSNCRRSAEIAAVGDPHFAALCFPCCGHRSERESERLGWSACVSAQ